MVLMALPLDVAPLRMTIFFFGVVDAMEEAFIRSFL